MELTHNGGQVPDKDAERRIWERVMAQKQAGSDAYKNLINSGGDSRYAVQNGGVVTEMPQAQAAVALQETGEDAFLKSCVAQELEDAKLYAALARCAPGRRASAVFMRLSNSELEHAKRFSTLFFLRTGEFYFPYAVMQTPRISMLNETLRECYRRESEDVLRYLRAAESTADPVLAEAFREAASEELGHAKCIRELIENILIP